MSSDLEKTRTVLKAKSLLGALPDDVLDNLIQRARRMRFAKGEAIYQRGDVGDSLMVILSGRVKITNVSAQAREVVLNFVGEGDLVGELAVLDSRERSADANALETTEALLLYRRDLLPVLEAHPKALLGIIARLSQKVRTMSALVEANTLRMAGRAASGLLLLAGQHGRAVVDGILIELKVSQGELGSYLGLSRENTSRQLGQLRDAGIIRLDDSRIVILDRDALEAYAETGAD